MDLIQDDLKMNKAFTDKELTLIKEYRTNPHKYPEKYSFFQMAFGDPKFKKLYFNKSGQYFSYATNTDEVNKWKNSLNYEMDMNILKKSYRLRLALLDELIGKFLTFYKTIEKDTALVIGGDHGESIYEHDYMSHSFIPYDEVIRFFHAIHFPNQEGKVEINQQISQSSIFDIVEMIANGDVDESNFVESHHPQEDDHYFFSQSCAGDVASLRIDNKWKFIYFPFEERSKLFNLVNDPNELTDVSEQHPELVEEYKILTIDRLTQKRAVKRVLGVLCY
jgi:arylsulfatase A-like enzyme